MAAELSVNCPKCRAPNSVPLGADVETYNCSSCGAVNPVVEASAEIAPADPLIGATISDCKIVAKIGEGGFGAVYKANDQNLQRSVALKVMLQSLTSSEDFVKKFIREAITAAQLNHPNIVAIHKVGRDEKLGIHYLIMEFLEGKTLADLVEDKGVLKPEEAISIILQCSEALAAAHDKNIVHRDIKPENIMIDRRGTVKIMDFGLAKVVQPDMKSTKVMGTPHYMSPEQFEGKQVDGRTDIYSLGVTFFYVLSKARPYEGTNTVQIIYAILTSEPKSLLEANPAVPAELWTIVKKMIAKKVEDRYQNFREIRKDLLTYQEKSLADRINCPSCGARNPRGRKFCRQCGENLQVKCPACNADEVAGVQVCSHCGAQIETLVTVRQNLERALKLKSVGDLRRAFLLLKEVLKLDPAHAIAKKELLDIETALKEVESTQVEALELEKTGNLQEALQKVESLLGRYPAAEEVKRQRDTIKRAYDARIIGQHVARADEATAAGNLPAAMASLDGALRLDPAREDVLAKKKEVEAKIGAADEARNAASAAFEAKRYAEAFRRATEVLRAHPTDAAMAQVLEKCRGFLESSEEFVRRGSDHLRAGRLPEAKKELEAATQLRPDDEKVRSMLADVDARLTALRRKLAEARTALAEREFETARQRVAEVVRALPGDPEALGLMATIARQEQESKKATSVKMAMDEGADYEKDGNLEGALTCYQQALEVDSDSSDAGKARDRVEARLREISSVRALADEHLRDGRYEEALDALERLRKLLPADTGVANEAEDARAKALKISSALRRAEEAASRMEHAVAVEASKEVLSLSGVHHRAQSLKRDAERAMAVIERHLKEADRLIGSELFDEALDQLKKAKTKGAREKQTGELHKVAVEGITAALKTEATRSYTMGDYAAALDAYERILELRGSDGDASKGKKEAEKRLRALTSEPLSLRAVVAGAAAVLLFMFQVAAVQFNTEHTAPSGGTGQPTTTSTVRPIEEACWDLENAGQWAQALEAWKKQDARGANKDVVDNAAQFLGAYLASGDGTKDTYDRLVEFQKVDGVLGQSDEKVREKRIAAGRERVQELSNRLLAELKDEEAKGTMGEPLAMAGKYADAEILSEGRTHLGADALVKEANSRLDRLKARDKFAAAIKRAALTPSLENWVEAVEKVEKGAEDIQDGTLRTELLAEYRVTVRDEWRKSLLARFPRDPKTSSDTDFLRAVQEASDFAERFVPREDEKAFRESLGTGR